MSAHDCSLAQFITDSPEGVVRNGRAARIKAAIEDYKLAVLSAERAGPGNKETESLVTQARATLLHACGVEVDW